MSLTDFDPTVGGTDTGAATQDTGEALGAGQSQDQPQQTGRTYSQAEFDSHMAGLRRSERERAQREVQRIQSEYERAMQQPRQPQQQEPPWRAEIAPLQEQMLDLSIDREASQLSKRYPDFEANEKDILQTAVDHRITDLELAYKVWRSDKTANVDVEAIRKQAVEDYLKGKTTQARTTPSPAGRGGASPTGAKAPSFKDGSADRAVREILRRAKEHAG